jgi:hypothetical protein
LILAVGGGSFALAITDKKSDKKIAKKVANKQITKRAPNLSVNHAKSADNAAKLGGNSPSSYQGFCKAGAIKATLVMNTAGFTSTTFQNVPGFNCFQPGNTTTSVQLKKLGPGQFQVRFVGNQGPDASGSAVCSGLGNTGDYASCSSAPGGSDASGENVFNVTTLNHSGLVTDNLGFSLLAF